MCEECKKTRKKWTIEDCRKLAEEKGGECLEDKYINISTKMWWKCSCSYTWQTKFSKILIGRWCPKCGGRLKKTIEDAQIIANKNDGICLSTEYVNNKSLLWWKCSNSHIWPANYHNILQGKWCPYCCGNVKLSIEDANNEAKKKNGKCLSDVYEGIDFTLWWECGFGHQWPASLYRIKNMGTWCPDCAGNRKKTVEDAQHLADINNGICLSTEYKNAHSVLWWRCKDGHEWPANYNNIKSGKWCPHCSSGKSQKYLYEIIKNIYSEYKILYNYKQFEWLTLNKKLEIDIWTPAIKLAIEYDGEQHFKPVEIFGGMEGFKATQKRDKIKNQLIAQHPEDIKYFIRFKYDEPLEKEYVIENLKKYGVPLE